MIKVQFYMKIRPQDEVYIFAYDKDQVYLPSLSRIYGSDFRKISNVRSQRVLVHLMIVCWNYRAYLFQIRFEEDKYGHYQYYEILQTYYKDMDLLNNKCEDEGLNVEKGVSVRECIEQAIDFIMECHIPWHISTNKTDVHEDCSTESQYLTYADLTERLASMGARHTCSYILICKCKFGATSKPPALKSDNK